MKKALLAILVVTLVVSCFAMVFTANAAADEVATADTLTERGYLKYGDEYYNIDLEQNFEDETNITSPFNIGSFYASPAITTINGSNALTATVPTAQAVGSDRWRGTVSFEPWRNKYSKIYVQFDAYMTGNFVNMYNDPPYSSIQWNGSKWFTEGAVVNFNATLIAENTHRISFFMDETMPNGYTLQTAGDTEHKFAIDNLIIAGLDTVRAPWVSSETVTYNTYEPQDVNVNLDAKGQAITGVTCGGEAIDAANFSYADETLTLKAEAFNGKSGDLSFTATTAGGSVNFTVKQEQTQKPVTANLVSDNPINKYVDGTTDVKENIALTLSGVEEGHDVQLSYTAAYDSAAAGTGKTITLTLSLTGADAYLYKLTNGTLEITGCEIYDYISLTPSYNGNPVVKYEDGKTTVAADSITLVLDGLVQGDVVNVTFEAAYDNAAVGERKINITNIVLSGKDAYKYTLAKTSLQIDGEIVARTVTTAYYDGVIEKRFDGTTFLNTKGIELSLSDIADGDQVSVIFRAYFTNVDAGESTVKITDIVLTGRDAYKYRLSTDKLDVDGYILAMKDVAISDDKGYYTMDGQTLQSIDFENVTVGNLSANSVKGLYIESSPGANQTASAVNLDGNRVLKVATNCFTWTTQLFATNETSVYRDAGIYAVAFKVKPEGATIVEAIVRNSDANDVTGILADFRLAISYDNNGKVTKAEPEFTGWTLTVQKYTNGVYKVETDGWISCYFEFEVPVGTHFDNQYKPNVTFLGASPNAGDLSTFYFDDIKYICKSNSNKYMTIDHNYDMEGVNGATVTDTPFYSEWGFVYDNEWTTEFVDDNTVIRLDIPANTSVQNVGAFKNSVSDGALKLFKGKGLHYVQFDFDMTCSSFKLYSHGEAGSFNFWAISCRIVSGNYVFEVECYDGWITNLKTEIVSNGMTRVSFLVDMTGSAYDATYIQLEASAGSAGGSVFFDNLFVSHEDYTPVAGNAKYDFVGMQNVVFNADLKGAHLLGLELDGEPVSSDKFVYDAEADTITLDKSLFVTNNPNAAARRLTIKTSAGDISAIATIEDNRPKVNLTLDYKGDAISKDYDGTTNVDQSVIDAIIAQIVMNGVTEGDDVSFTYDIAYSSKNAGSVTIVITNIALSGDDAGKYTLKTTSLSVNASINKIQLTVSGTTAANKEYDGTVNANAEAGKLNGVLAGENVTLSISSAMFNSKDVASANKVTVVYALSGADAANYIVPVAHDITNVSISKKTVTVTADAKTVTLGENDPELTYNVTGLIAGDSLTGTLVRKEGTEAGEYDILQGTLNGGDNYQINFVSAKFTIVETDTEPTGLSTGAIVGIVVGVVAAAGIAAAVAVFVLKKRRSK